MPARFAKYQMPPTYIVHPCIHIQKFCWKQFLPSGNSKRSIRNWMGWSLSGRIPQNFRIMAVAFDGAVTRPNIDAAPKSQYCLRVKLKVWSPAISLSNTLINMQTDMSKLKTVYCSNNEIVSLDGINKNHEFLKYFYCLPNEKLSLKETHRVTTKFGITCRTG